MKTASWIIMDETNKPVYETFSEKEAEIFNRKRGYKAVPIVEYLASLNVKQDLPPKGSSHD